ncbi:MAG: glycosyltransferase [Thermoanaerobaculales bacterium]|nr:glycosyltransferase [Thermoanaerobaculales bacterium]
MVDNNELKAERDALRAEVEELSHTKDFLYEKWQASERQLRDIHGSKMWRLWMFYIGCRRVVLFPFTVVFGLLSFIRQSFDGLARFLGWCYLGLAVSWISMRARIRRASRRGECLFVPTTTSVDLNGVRPRVLLAMPYHIYPANHGGGVRLFNLVKLLSKRCDLYLLVFSIIGEDDEQRKALEPYCVRLDFHTWVPKHRPDRFDIKPPSAQLFWSEQVTELIRDLVLAHDIDIVQLEYTELGQYAAIVPAGVPVILTEHDISFRTQRRRRKLRFMDRYPESKVYCATRADLRRLLVHEIKVCRESDHLHMMSEIDAEYLSSFLINGGAHLRVAPNGVDCAVLAPKDDLDPRKDILYVGNFQNLPNMDAIEYLVQDVWPILRLRCPNATLTVVGACAEGKITHFDGKNGVHVVGEVPEIAPYYHSHRALAAPIRAGSGTRLKILEAFAAGIPVVSTSLGAEGIVYEDGRHLLIADDAVAFARALEKLLTDDEELENLSREGMELAKARYDWARVADAILADYAELMQSRTRRAALESRPGGIPEARHATAQIINPGSGKAAEPLISVTIPTFHGGDKLVETIDAILKQDIDIPFEIVCVDSGSPQSDIDAMLARGAQVWSIDERDFNHGMTRDLLAKLSRGEILVLLNQDAVPAHDNWLKAITEPLRNGDKNVAAIQGAIREVDNTDERFFWDSCGERFYFTSESNRWIETFQGVGFSTVNCAIRNNVLFRHPFGWAPMMEDKKWQRKVTAQGFLIGYSEEGLAIHTHNYDMRGLIGRCRAEGFGWRFLGETYGLFEMLRDMCRFRVYRELFRGILKRRVRSSAELLFPVLRPITLYWGNHFSNNL